METERKRRFLLSEPIEGHPERLSKHFNLDELLNAPERITYYQVGEPGEFIVVQIDGRGYYQVDRDQARIIDMAKDPEFFKKNPNL